MDEIRRLLVELGQRIEKFEKGFWIKKITIPTDGYFVIQKLTADPAGGALIEGMIWENTTTHHLKIYLNGSVTTII
jgi:hypothetical protein